MSVRASYQHSRVRSLLDLERPIGMIAPAMHFFPHSRNPAQIIAEYRTRLPLGSYIALAHLSADPAVAGMVAAVEAYRSTRYHLYPRDRPTILAMCAGFDLIGPGLATIDNWCPLNELNRPVCSHITDALYAVVGRKNTET